MTEAALNRFGLSLIAGLLVGASCGFWWGMGAMLSLHGVLFLAEKR